MTLLVSGDGKAPLQINQDAFIYAGRMKKNSQLIQKIKHQAYVLVSDGSIDLDGEIANKGDGLEVINQNGLNIKAIEDAEVLIIDVPETSRV